jgi:predicted phage terminase large subunit-like protein
MYIQSWDTAFKTGEEHDYCVGIGMGLYHGNIFIREMLREKMTFPELLIKSRRFFEQAPHKPRLVLVEDKASGQSLLQVFKTGSDVAGAKGSMGMLPVMPVKADNDPVARVQAVSGFIESHRVYLPTGPTTEWVKDFTDEVEGFPTKAHDDITMALVHGLNYLTKGDKFTPLDTGAIISTAERSVEPSLGSIGWSELPGNDSMGAFLRELT